MKITFLLLDIIIFLAYVFVLLKIILKYAHLFVRFMFNVPQNWNKYIEKPKLLIYLIFIPFSLCFYFLFKEASRETIFQIVVKIMLAFCVLIMLFFCYFSWTKRFQTSIVSEMIDLLKSKVEFDKSLILEKNVELIFKRFVEKEFLQGDIESFKSMLRLESIPENKKIKWTSKIHKKPNEINRQTLIEFLSCLFNGFENESNEGIIKFCKTYFYISESEEFQLTSKNVSDWRKNKSKYLNEVSELIKG